MSQFSEHRIIQKYQAGECTPEEEHMVEDYIIFINTTSQNFQAIQPDLNELHLRTVGRLVDRIKARNTVRLAKSVAVAASISILLGFGTMFIAPSKNEVQTTYVNDVDPGSDKAILTLANGTKINLSDARRGSLFSQSGIEIIKAEDGTLVYKVAASNSNTSAYNTITTPKGGQYKIILPDGTRVWLNAASSLSYRTSLNDRRGERKVHLVGEAYFEVSKLESVIGIQKQIRRMPFIVKTFQQEVIVLGTHFNINSYDDETDTKTTLLEGSVSISTPDFQGDSTMLKPGEQGVNNGSEIKVKKVDTDGIVAWKNGKFIFAREPLENIMRQLARWYDVEVVYKDEDLKSKTFGGSTSRYENIFDVLYKLQLTGQVHFKVKGKQVTVMK